MAMFGPGPGYGKLKRVMRNDGLPDITVGMSSAAAGYGPYIDPLKWNNDEYGRKFDRACQDQKRDGDGLSPAATDDTTGAYDHWHPGDHRYRLPDRVLVCIPADRRRHSSRRCSAGVVSGVQI